MSIEGATQKRIKVGDIEIAYFEAGEGRPLVLLHGGLIDATIGWSEIMPRLARRYRVYAPDSRGHGGTDNPSGRLGYDQMADDVAGFIAALGLERPILIGYSDGGQNLIEFGMRHPGQAAALVMGGVISEQTDTYRQGIRDWGFVGPGECDYDRMRGAFGDFFETIKQVHGRGDPTYWQRFLPQTATLWHTVPAYTTAQLATIKDPTLVISGDRDQVAGPLQGKRIVDVIGGSELAIVPGVGHDAVNRSVFWALVDDFLDRRANPETSDTSASR